MDAYDFIMNNNYFIYDGEALDDGNNYSAVNEAMDIMSGVNFLEIIGELEFTPQPLY